MKLEDKVQLMQKSYFKGFGNLVFGIYLNINNYHNIKQSTHIKELILESLNKLETHYQSLPFEEYQYNSDFEPLYLIQDLLDIYGQLIRDFFNNPSNEKLNTLNQCNIAILKSGETYSKKFWNRVKELKQFPQYAQYNVEFIDHKGDHFNMNIFTD